MGRPKSDKHAARLTVTLDEHVYAEVCQIAEKNDVSAAWVIRRAVDQYLGHLPPPAPDAGVLKQSRGRG